MNDDQKFFFDLKGWLLLPAVISEREARDARDHVLAEKSSYTGPAGELLDHPAVVDVLENILTTRKSTESSYFFRCENSFHMRRKAGDRPSGTDIPHTVMQARQGGPMSYSCRNGRIYSGLTRVVWELNPVRKGMGGTLFLSGTHKAEEKFPPSLLQPDHPMLESYECPAGSAFIFSESLLHAGTTWKDPEHERVAIFNCYNSLWAQWHRTNVDHATVSAMPVRRQSLFRGVYAHDFQANNPNLAYSEANRAL